MGDTEAEFQHAIVNSLECVTGRHLFETTVRRVADALGLDTFTARCENLAQLTFELSRMLKYPPQPARRHFVLVFDGIDRQREAPPTLLPALARLSETVSFAKPHPCPQATRPRRLQILTGNVRFPASPPSSSSRIHHPTPCLPPP